MNQGIKKYMELMDDDYFDGLPKTMQNAVREFVAEFVSPNDGYGERIEEVECRARSGFSPFSWNRGGIEGFVYNDLMHFWGGGYTVGVKEAQDAIEKWTEVAFKEALENFIEKYAEELSDLGVLNDQVNYHDLERLGFSELAEEFSQYESESTSGEYSSTLHSVRVIYSGSGKWAVAVLHRISDAPYHRTCDGFKEWEFEARTLKQLQKQLDKIKKQVEDAWL